MPEKRIILITFIMVFFLIIVLVGFIASILFVYQKKQRAVLRELDDVKNRYNQELLKSQLEMQEQTLLHISRELHDNIGQFISLAKLQLNTFIGEKPERAGRLQHTVDLLTQALDDLRDISKSLSLEVIKSGGLTKAIESQVEQLQKTDRYKIDFIIKGNYNYLEEQKEIFLFRILQESINNIIRHAAATKVGVILEYTPEQVSMQICDNGVGFDSLEFTRGGKSYRHGGGLSNIAARAKLIDADYLIQSEQGKGTTVRITVQNKNEYELTEQ